MMNLLKIKFQDASFLKKSKRFSDLGKVANTLGLVHSILIYK